MIYDAIIIGGGPAGLMAANMLNEKKVNYLLIEKNERVGKKILLTGGKRCNVTNNLSVKDFIEALNLKDKRFLYEALNQFGPKDVIAFFKSKGLNLILENNFKYFPETQKSQSVIDALMQGIDQHRIVYKSAVKRISIVEEVFLIETQTEQYSTKKVLLSTGSNAYPTVGSSGDGLIFAEKLGLPIIPFTPAETYVYSSDVQEHHKDLQGVVIHQSTISIKQTKKRYTGDLLFTHFGLSGPVILHASEDIYDSIEEGKNILTIQMTDLNEEALMALLRDFRMKMPQQFLEHLLTKKLALKVLAQSGVRPVKIAELSSKEIQSLMNGLTAFEIKLDRVESIEKAFVNRGGIDTKSIDPKTMQSKLINHLYLAGELTNLHGPIGGFNITIALSTGRLAGLSMAK